MSNYLNPNFITSNGNEVVFRFTDNLRKGEGILIKRTGRSFGLEIKTKYQNKTTPQKIYLTPKLENPDFDLWNQDTQSFICGRVSKEIKSQVDYNNDVLNNLLEELIHIAKTNNVKDGKEIKLIFQTSNIKTKQKPKHYYTLAECTKIHINKLKTDNNTEEAKKSTNYQVYQTFLSKLTKQKQNKKYPRFADIPITNINSEIYSLWCDYLIKELKGTNLLNMQKMFKAVYNKARTNKELRSLNLTEIKFIWENPKSVKRNSNGIVIQDNSDCTEKAISQEEFKTITKYTEMFKPNKKHEVFIDACLLQYYLLARPKDIVNLNWGDIHIDENKNIWTWETPHYKMRNKENPKKYSVIIAIPSPAKEILKKYQNTDTRIKGNYVLPLPCNLVEKDYNKNFKYFENKTKKTQEEINKYLKEVDTKLRLHGLLKCKHPLTMYTFRHSIITHLIEKHIPSDQIALWACTSVEMIYSHYIDKTKIANSYQDIFNDTTM
jgi:integrase